MIIDCHTHLYTDEAIAGPKDWAFNRNEYHWADLTSSPLQGWADSRRMLHDMDNADVDKAVLLGWYWENESSCREQNEFYADCVKQNPDRFIAFAALNPSYGISAIDEIKRAHDNGFKGIGELHFGLQGYDLNDPAWESIADYAQEHGMIVNFHVTEAVGRDHPGRIPTPFDAFQKLVCNFPDLKIILAHWGGLLPFYEMNPAVKKDFKNVYYDTAASPLLYDPRIFRSVVDIVGAEKVLYGSDYPLRLFPGTVEEHDFKSYIDYIKSSGLTDSEQSLILGENAKTLLGI